MSVIIWFVLLLNQTQHKTFSKAIFKKEQVQKESIKPKKEEFVKAKNEKLSPREKEFLYKKKLRTKADILIEK